MPADDAVLYGAEKAARFWARIDRRGPDECWNWTGHLTHNGYGRFAPRVNGRLVRVFAYRYSYVLENGPIPDGLEPDHLCKNRACVNPRHLEIVTHRVNCLRSDSIPAANAKKTECDHGHPFDRENTYITPGGRRNCRTCLRLAVRRYRARKAVA